MTVKRCTFRRGFTLVELTVSVSLTTILFGGMASALVLTSRAIPDAGDPGVLRIEGHGIVEQMANDLWCAQSFSTRTAHSVAFQVADRSSDIDSDPDTLTYEWSGTPGDPLYRTITGEPARIIAENVHDFQIAYGISTTSETMLEESLQWTDVQILASFTGWSGISPSTENFSLSTSNHGSQFFTINPPPGAVAMEITRGWAMIQKGLVSVGNAIAEIRRSKNDGNFQPSSTAIGSPSVRSVTSLFGFYAMTDFPFTDAIITDFSRNDYCLVLRGSVLSVANLQVYTSASAPSNGTAHTWSTNAGESWSPAAKDINKRDIPFRIDGRFQAPTMVETTFNRYFVNSVRLALQLGESAGAWTETAVEILNGPEVSSP
jgi:hypothetical protein